MGSLSSRAPSAQQEERCKGRTPVPHLQHQQRDRSRILLLVPVWCAKRQHGSLGCLVCAVLQPYTQTVVLRVSVIVVRNLPASKSNIWQCILLPLVKEPYPNGHIFLDINRQGTCGEAPGSEASVKSSRSWPQPRGSTISRH